MSDALRHREHLAARLAEVERERDMLLRLIGLYDQWLTISGEQPIETPERVGASGPLGSPAPAPATPVEGPADEVGKTGAAPEVAAPPIEAAPASSLRLSMKDAAAAREAATRAAGPYPCPHCPRSFPLPRNVARHLSVKHPDGAPPPAAPPSEPWSPEPVGTTDVKVEIRHGKEWFLCTRCPTRYPTRAKLAQHLTHDHKPEERGAMPVGRAPHTYNGRAIRVAGTKLA